MSKAVLRKRPRALLNHAAHLLATNGQPPTALRLIDISETGARIASEGAPLNAGLIEVEWSPCPGLAPLLLRGEAVWRDKKLCGIHFLDLGAKERAVVRALIHYHRPD